MLLRTATGTPKAVNNVVTDNKNCKSTPKRKIHDMSDDDEGDYDYDDEMSLDYNDADDVDSLLNSSTREKQASSCSGTDDRDLLDDIDASLDEDDDVGPETSPKLASIANKAFSKMPVIEIVKKKKNTYRKPKNCDKVLVPTVNREIWRRMKQGFLKKRDLRLINIQSSLTKSAFAAIEVAQYLLKQEQKEEGKEGKEAAIRACTDIIYMLGHANTSLSLQRRELLKPVLKSDAGLCDASVPLTSQLFGDDLSKTLKETRQASNLGREYHGSKNWKKTGYKPRNEHWNQPGGSGNKKKPKRS